MKNLASKEDKTCIISQPAEGDNAPQPKEETQTPAEANSAEPGECKIEQGAAAAAMLRHQASQIKIIIDSVVLTMIIIMKLKQKQKTKKITKRINRFQPG